MAETNSRLHLDAKYRPSKAISANSKVLALPDLPLPNIVHLNLGRDLPQQPPTTMEVPVGGFFNGKDDYIAPTYLKILGGIVLALIFVTVMAIYVHGIYTILNRKKEERRNRFERHLSSDESGPSSTKSDGSSIESDMEIQSNELTPLKVDWLYLQPETLRRHALNLATIRPNGCLGGPVLYELCGCEVCRYTFQTLAGNLV